MICKSCDKEYEPTPPEQMIVASGGFCMPADQVYDMRDHTMDDWCSRCRARWLIMLELGIDIDLLQSVPRGGIKFAEMGADE